jgi:hypothetical protein
MSGLRLLFYYILYPCIAKCHYISSLANVTIKFNVTSTSYHINPSFRKWEQKKVPSTNQYDAWTISMRIMIHMEHLHNSVTTRTTTTEQQPDEWHWPAVIQPLSYMSDKYICVMFHRIKNISLTLHILMILTNCLKLY